MYMRVSQYLGIGGILSVGQLVLDAELTHNWSSVTGDIAKFLLGSVCVGIAAST